MEFVSVHEVFASIQGESSYAGLSCFFIRLAGCNLHCGYCDTVAAREGGGREMSLDELSRAAREAKTAIVEITGGEPLLQEGCSGLARRLRDESGKPVLVETNGSRDISAIPDGVVAVMDVKCPDSGEGGSFDMGNLERLRPLDEVKFVVGGRSDYDWAVSFVEEHGIAVRCAAVFVSPVWGRLTPVELARWIVEDTHPVRLQVQLHKVLGVR